LEKKPERRFQKASDHVVRVALDRHERDLRVQSDVMLDFYKLEHKNGNEHAQNPTAKHSQIFHLA
jgi:hypothetical protein